MTWKQSISLGAADKLFENNSATFAKNTVQGGYVARLGKSGKLLKRDTLMECIQEAIPWVVLEPLFSEIGVTFEEQLVEGESIEVEYVARLGDKQLRRPTLMKCAQAVMNEWIEVKK